MKKSILLSMAVLICSIGFSQTQKMNGWNCRTFTVQIGCCGVSISSELTVCCGCAIYAQCGCTVSRGGATASYDGYIVVDELLKNRKITSNVLTITKSNKVAGTDDNMNYSIVTGDYNIIEGESGHKLLVVKVTGN